MGSEVSVLDRIDTLAGVVELLWRKPMPPDSLFGDGAMHCVVCGRLARMSVRAISRDGSPRGISPSRFEIESALPPALFKYTCAQCEVEYIALVYAGPSGQELAVFSPKLGGLSTLDTPPGVAYYLDQAHRDESVSAMTSAVAMYRGALEHLLFQQGYDKAGMLSSKIAALEKDIKAKTAKAWAIELETEYLTIMNQLGNGSIHPNDGDVTKQAQLDRGLIASVKELFGILLFLVYEVPFEKGQRLAALRAKAAIFKK